MSEIKRLHPAARYSEGSIHAGTVYLAGQVAVGGATTIEARVAKPEWKIEIVVIAAV